MKRLFAVTDVGMDILLVDDHTLFCQGLALVLEKMEQKPNCVFAHSAQGAKELCQDKQFDVILLDYNLPDCNDLSLLQALRQQQPQSPIIMLSAQTDTQLIQRTIALGASGFITKDSNADIMKSAIELVLAGGIYLPPELLKANLNAEAAPAAPSKPALIVDPNHKMSPNPQSSITLTQRQLDVLQLLEQGLANKEIARQLTMSPSTVKVHVAAILRACQASNRTQAVAFARQHNLLG